MEKFEELSLKEMQEVDGGVFGSDVFERIGYAIAEAWCDIENALYNSKKINDMRGEDSTFALWGF
tara:strand:- start:264 stop:458 length:195 start_codon:yes stop_codon:yes gene_type:complete